MSAENNVTFKPVTISHPSLSMIISPSIGMATEQKIHRILTRLAVPMIINGVIVISKA